MSRPKKERKVCEAPRNSSFAPLAGIKQEGLVFMTIDEYEAIRLIDLAEYTQEECAVQMGVARTTVQGIYIEARKKLANALVNGKTLLIEGGDVAFCKGGQVPCQNKCQPLCRKQEELHNQSCEN